MNLIKTKFSRIREIKAQFSIIHNKYNFIAGISTDCKLALWSCADLLEFDKDLEDLKPARIVKSKQRLTCIAINNMEELLDKDRAEEQALLGKR